MKMRIASSAALIMLMAAAASPGQTKDWDRRFGGAGDEYCGDVVPIRDGGYLLAGSSTSGADGDKTEASRGGADFWIVRLDATGAKQWDRRFGGTQADYVLDIVQTSDAGYLLGGLSLSGAGGDKTQSLWGISDYWIVKVAPFEPADAYEADNVRTRARTLANDGAQSRSLHQAGDADWAKFTVGRTGARNVRIETAGPLGDTELWLYDGSPRQLAFDQDSGAGRFSRIALAHLASGTYYVRVRARGNSRVIPAYTLRARWSNAAIARDAYENDNTLSVAKAIRNGQTQRRTIHAAGNRDWARFTVGAGGGTGVRIETAGASGDTQLWLYDAAGRRLAYDDNSGPGLFSRIRRNSLPAGRYYVRVQEKGNNGKIPAYTLKARWTAR